jgi:beta-aspartyl-peptidase (threonine type)
MSQKNILPYKLVIHGGAGTISRARVTADMEKKIHAALRDALEAGRHILSAGGSALDAVEAAVRNMEDCEHFNAGKGSVYTSDERHELEASIMDGRTLDCGTVMMISSLRNPVSAARLVMERTPHVSLSGEAAEALGSKYGLASEPPAYFHTDRRWKALQKVKALTDMSQIEEEDRHGTVGAVAMDVHGHIATATSTGGTTNKMAGRIGDTPIIGAATWADDRTCGVSTTGQGEYFMRLATARDIAALVEYRNMDIESAARTAIEKMGRLGGNGGVVGIDKNGNIAMVFNSEGMYRGFADAGEMQTYLYDD